MSYRNNNEPDERNDNIGFRCVRDEERGYGSDPRRPESWRAAAASVPSLLPGGVPGRG
ncbi:MAG: hypothetical protein ABSH50_23650 [Bryobacteraceae bacterium]